jgi:GrpB-like predicted nucleotidyltransferase (UPF0157 family)
MPDAPVEIVPFDPAWAELFERERSVLRVALGKWIAGPIEHVGSTAVEGLAAKPVIDIMVGVKSLAASRPAIAAVAELGYQYADYRADVMHWFCKPSAEIRTHHLHLVPFGGSLWRERLLFRDVLRAEPSVARAYEDLKRELAARHRLDRDRYTAEKTDFIAGVIARARPT